MAIKVTKFKAELTVPLAENQEPKSLDIHIYDEVTGVGTFDWSTLEYQESETSAEHIQNLLEENKDIDNINVYINSCGGSVYEGLAIYNQLKRHKAHKTVIVDGFACSIASVIAMAGDKVIMPKTSMLMIHNAWTCAAGNAKELRKVADDLDIMSETIAQAYLEKSAGKITPEELNEMLDNETYLKAEDCLKYGLCDSLGQEESAEEKAKEAMNSFRKSAMALANAMNFAEVPEVKAEEKTEEDPPVIVEHDDNEDLKAESDSAEPTEPSAESAVDIFMKLFTRKAV